MTQALRYPVSGDSPFRTLLAGAVLGSLGFLVLPALVVTGYYGRVLARSSRDEAPPAFEDVGALVVEGVRTWLAIGGYLFAGALVFVVLGTAALVLGFGGTGLGAEVGVLALAVLVLLVVGLFAFPAWYFVPAALTNLATDGSVRAAFDVGAVLRVIFDRRYFAGWLAGVCLLAVGTGAYYALTFAIGDSTPGISIAGHVVGAGVNFYAGTAAFYCFGRGYAAATGNLAVAADRDGRPAGEDRVVDDAATAASTTGAASDEWGADADRWRDRRRDERERDRRSDRERELRD